MCRTNSRRCGAKNGVGLSNCAALVPLRGCSSRREIMDDLVSGGWGQEQGLDHGHCWPSPLLRQLLVLTGASES